MLAKRVLTAVLLALAVGAAIAAGPRWGPAAVIAILVLAGAWEWAGLVSATATGAGWRSAYVAAVAVAMGVAWFWGGATPARVLVICWLAAAWWLAALVLLLRRMGAVPEAAPAPPVSGPRHLPSWFVALAGVLSLVPAWLALGQVHVRSSGAAALLTVILLTVAADVGAYFTGRLTGRRPLVPQVSPGKTVEGLAGGLALSLVISLLLLATPLARLPGLPAVALLVALAAALGDLTVSLFKRNAGVKHSGRLLPGHGGVLDRIDSYCASAPAFALWLAFSGAFP